MKPTKLELRRLEMSKVTPDFRFHYRWIASGYAIRASKLLSNNSEELADVLNMAGNWIKKTDEKLGNRYYQIVEKRCPNTQIGQQILAKHWFIDDLQGPWSKELEALYPKWKQVRFLLHDLISKIPHALPIFFHDKSTCTNVYW